MAVTVKPTGTTHASRATATPHWKQDKNYIAALAATNQDKRLTSPAFEKIADRWDDDIRNSFLDAVYYSQKNGFDYGRLLDSDVLHRVENLAPLNGEISMILLWSIAKHGESERLTEPNFVERLSNLDRTGEFTFGKLLANAIKNTGLIDELTDLKYIDDLATRKNEHSSRLVVFMYLSFLGSQKGEQKFLTLHEWEVSEKKF